MDANKLNYVYTSNEKIPAETNDISIYSNTIDWTQYLQNTNIKLNKFNEAYFC